MENGKPHSKESEAAILGSMLLDPQRVMPKLSLEDNDFYFVQHRLLYNYLRIMYVKNMTMDMITIRNYLQDSKVLDSIGGEEYLLDIQDSVIVPSHVKHYQSKVKECSDLRVEIDILEKGLTKAYEGESCTDQVMSSLIRRTTDDSDSQSIYDLGNEWIEKVESGNTGHLNWR